MVSEQMKTAATSTRHHLVAANAGCIEQLVKKNVPLMVVNTMKTNPNSSIVQKVMTRSQFSHVTRMHFAAMVALLTYGFCLPSNVDIRDICGTFNIYCIEIVFSDFFCYH